MSIITVSCYNCGTDKSEFVLSENGFNLVKCTACGLFYVNPRPDESEQLQATTTGLHKGETALDVNCIFNENQMITDLRILAELYGKALRRSDNYKWLDIGCGNGEFIKALQIHSRNKGCIKGSEPNANKRAYAKNQGLDVDFIDLDRQHEKYDYVSILNVYSHLNNPIETIKKIKGILKDNGELLLQTGDTTYFGAKRYPIKNFGLPDHLSFTSEKIIRENLDKLHFEIIKIKKYYYSIQLASPKDGIMRAFKSRIKFILINQQIVPNRFFPKTDMWIRARQIKPTSV